MQIQKFNSYIKFILFFTLLYSANASYANKAYFDLSQNEINIKTDFSGKELILFGIVEPNHDVIVIVRGPEKNITVRGKHRILRFWFNTRSVIYQNIPSVYLISSSAKINNIINQKEILLNQLSFESIKMVPANIKDLFVDLSEWNDSLIRVQKQNNLYKEFDLKIIDEKLFQTRLYFPSNIPTGKYLVSIYQIKNKQIFSSSNKTLLVEKSGIGNKIYKFAQNSSILYGIGTILFAIITGIGGAMMFRKF